MARDTQQHRSELAALSERLFDIKRAGIVNPSWIADRIAIETEKAMELARKQAARRKGFRLWPVALTRLVRPVRSARSSAKSYAKSVKSLMSKASIRDQEAFHRRLASFSTQPHHAKGLRRALANTWLEQLDLPLDALEDTPLRMMLSAAFYRFAYGRNQAIDLFSIGRALDSEGVYLNFHREAGTGIIEKRLLAFELSRANTRARFSIRAVELSRHNGALLVRSGVVIPNLGHDTFVLTGDVSLEECRAFLLEWAGAPDDPLFEINECEQPGQQGVTSAHRLGFLTLRTRNAQEIVGQYLDGEQGGQIVGARLEKGSLTSDIISSIGRFTTEDIPGLSVDDRHLIASIPRFAGDATDAASGLDTLLAGASSSPLKTGQLACEPGPPRSDIPSSAPDPNKVSQ